MRCTSPGPGGIPAWPVLVLCCSLLASSCQTGMHGVLRPVNRALQSCRASLHDPFYPADHIAITRAVAGGAIMEHRVKPATAVTGKRDLSLQDCRALALRNNLDIQVAGFDQMTKRALEFSSRSKLLPHLSVSGELSERNNNRYSYSDAMGQEGREPVKGGGPTVNNWSVGTERNTFRGNAELSWSPTDAALAYYLSRSSTNDRLKAHYQRVRVAQKLHRRRGGSVFSAPEPPGSRAGSARAGPRDDTKFSDVFRSCSNCNWPNGTAYKTVDGILPIDPKTAEMELIKARRLLTRLSNQLERQRNILASAMGLSPDYFLRRISCGRAAQCPHGLR